MRVKLHTWVLPRLEMMLGRIRPLVRPVGVRALPVCDLRRTSGGRIRVGPGMGWRVISGIPEGPGAISSTLTVTNTTFIQTKLVKELKVPATLHRKNHIIIFTVWDIKLLPPILSLWNLEDSYLTSDGWNKNSTKYYCKQEFMIKSKLPRKICFPVRVPSQRHKNNGMSINLHML